jgi:ABC-2 type transport system ATP-binding protein
MNIIKVSFKEPLEPEWIKRLPGIQSVSQLDRYSFTIETTDPDTVRKGLKKLEAENNLDIVSLQSENQSLEEVFRSLTGNISQGS